MLVSDTQFLALADQYLDVFVERALSIDDRLQQRLTPSVGLLQLGMMRADAQFELTRTFLEPQDLGGKRCRALDECRVTGTCFSGLCAERSRCIARIRQGSLCLGEAFFRCALFALEADARGVGLGASGFERGALLFCRAAFDGNH